jgi:hypothetical protein
MHAGREWWDFGGKEARVFFFEKKNQKTFPSLSRTFLRHLAEHIFKNEDLFLPEVHPWLPESGTSAARASTWAPTR